MKLGVPLGFMSAEVSDTWPQTRVKKGGDEWIEWASNRNTSFVGTRRVYVWFSLDCMPSPWAEEKVGHRPVGSLAGPLKL